MTTPHDVQRKAEESAERAAQVVRDHQAHNKAIGGVCDFCDTPVNEAPPGVTYVLDKDVVTNVIGITPEGGVGVVTLWDDPYWYACGICDPAVKDGTPESLAEHAIAHSYHASPTPRRSDLVALYTAFYAAHPDRREDFDPYTK
jgi:hypothetical protein